MTEDEVIRQRLPVLEAAAATFAKRHGSRRDEALSDALVGAMVAIRTHQPNRQGKCRSLVSWIDYRAGKAMLDGLRQRLRLRCRRPHAGLPCPLAAAVALRLPDYRSPPPSRRLELTEEVRQALRYLLPKERRLLELLYLEGFTQKETARRLRLSDSRVSQLHSQLLAQLHRLPAPPIALKGASS